MQRSRISWLKEGDRNTKFFHNKAVWRARKNKIQQLTGSIGVLHSDFVATGKVVNEYFEGIFTTDPTLDASTVVDLL